MPPGPFPRGNASSRRSPWETAGSSRALPSTGRCASSTEARGVRHPLRLAVRPGAALARAMAGAIFWGAAALVVYVYAGYPCLIFLLARLRPRPVRKAPVLPTVSFIIAAYNEERVIAAKLENTFALDYPAERLERRVRAPPPALHAAHGRRDQRRRAGDRHCRPGLPGGGRGRGRRPRARRVVHHPRGGRAARARHRARPQAQVPAAWLLPAPPLVPPPGPLAPRAALGGALLPGARLRRQPLPARSARVPPPLPRPARPLRRRGARLRARAAERPRPQPRHPALLLHREPGAAARRAGAPARREAGHLGDGARRELNSARLRLREHPPRRRVPVGGPLEGADQEPCRAAQTEAAQALEAPLPGEPAHDAFQVSDREARALELGHQLLAPPELVVDRVIMRLRRAGPGATSSRRAGRSRAITWFRNATWRACSTAPSGRALRWRYVATTSGSS